MPIYEYRCDDCGTRFEKLVRASNKDETSCPSCGKQHLEQQLSVFAAHGGSRESAAPAGCPGGMCPNAGLCGRNFN